MRSSLLFCFSVWIAVFSHGQDSSVQMENTGAIRIMQLRRDGPTRVRYPDALPSLLELMNERSLANFDPDPLFIESLADERLFEHPILYVNCDELPNFDFSS